MTKAESFGNPICGECVHYGPNTENFKDSDGCHWGSSDHFGHKLRRHHPACPYFKKVERKA